jgi:hypothetical protein
MKRQTRQTRSAPGLKVNPVAFGSAQGSLPELEGKSGASPDAVTSTSRGGPWAAPIREGPNVDDSGWDLHNGGQSGFASFDNDDLFDAASKEYAVLGKKKKKGHKRSEVSAARA